MLQNLACLPLTPANSENRVSSPISPEISGPSICVSSPGYLQAGTWSSEPQASPLALDRSIILIDETPRGEAPGKKIHRPGFPRANLPRRRGICLYVPPPSRPISILLSTLTLHFLAGRLTAEILTHLRRHSIRHVREACYRP